MDSMDNDLLFQVTTIEQISPRGWPRYVSSSADANGIHCS